MKKCQQIARSLRRFVDVASGILAWADPYSPVLRGLVAVFRHHLRRISQIVKEMEEALAHAERDLASEEVDQMRVQRQVEEEAA
jgi:hypothetical protein